METCPKCTKRLDGELRGRLWDGAGHYFEMECPHCHAELEVEVEAVPRFIIKAADGSYPIQPE